MEKMLNKQTKVPHAFVMIFILTILAVLLGYVVQPGAFQREVRQITPTYSKNVLIPGSFEYVEGKEFSFSRIVDDIFFLTQSIYKGLVAAADVVFTVLVPSASLFVFLATGVMDKLFAAVFRRFKKADIFMIPVLMLLFSGFSGFLGELSGTYGFLILFVPIAISMGYDAIVGLCCITFAGAIGFTAGMTNPYTVGVAHAISELPTFSGIGMRIASWLVMIGIAIAFTMRYALRIKKDPTKSVLYGLPGGPSEAASMDEIEAKPLDARDRINVALLVIMIAVLVYGVLNHGWGLSEICGVFFAFGVTSGLVGRMSPTKIADTFVSGAEKMAYGALAVGVARAIMLALEHGNILDSIIYSLSVPLSALPTWLSAQGMLLFQTITNFFIPSGSGQAATMMPIIAPLSDLLGIERQLATLAFCFGDGLSNTFWPTSGTVIVMTSLAGVPLDKWYKFYLPLIGLLYAAQMVLIFFAQIIGYN